MQSSGSNPPVKNRSTESVQEPKEEAFPEELMRLARPPKGITVEVKDGVLTIRQRWWAWSKEILFGVAVTALWDLVIILWYSTAIGVLRAEKLTMVGIFLIGIAIMHVVSGAIWTFDTACVALNASTLTVNPDHLAVTHGPLGPFAGVDAPTRSIEQIFITERGSVRPEHRPSPFPIKPGRFNVVARLHSGENHVLLEGVHRVEQAKFIEHRLEAFLGIVDKPVDGELAG